MLAPVSWHSTWPVGNNKLVVLLIWNSLINVMYPYLCPNPPRPPPQKEVKRGAADKANIWQIVGEKLFTCTYLIWLNLIDEGPTETDGGPGWRLIYSQSHWQQIDRPLTNEGNEIIL